MGNGSVPATAAKSSSVYANKVEKRPTNKQRLERILKDLDKSKQGLEEDIKRLEALKFKVGDFVVHKEHGNCIIIDHYMNLDKYNLGYDRPDNINSGFDDRLGYIVSGPGLYSEIVEEKDLMPYNKATKVLFENE